MLSRALSLATVTLLISCLAAIPVRAQNLDAGKSPSQIFSGTCSACHKGPRGLLKTVPAGSLPGFLRQHYTTSSEMASQLSAFLISNGATDTRVGSKPTQQPKDARPAVPEQLDRFGRPIRPAPPQEAARPEAEPQQAAKQDGLGPDGRKSAAKQKLSKRGKPEEPPKPDAAETSRQRAKQRKRTRRRAKPPRKPRKPPRKRPRTTAAKPHGEAPVSIGQGRCTQGERRNPGAAARSGSPGHARAPGDVGRRCQRHVGAVSGAGPTASSSPGHDGFHAAIAAGPARGTARATDLPIDLQIIDGARWRSTGGRSCCSSMACSTAMLPGASDGQNPKPGLRPGFGGSVM